MGLPWVRLQSNIAAHDKVLCALSKRNGKAAMAVYMFSLGWSGGQETDGHIPSAALFAIHGTLSDAAVLVSAGLWDEDEEDGWWIRNFGRRQETREENDARRERARAAAMKRWGGKK